MINLKNTRRALLTGFVAVAALLPLGAAQAKETAPAPKMWVIKDADSTVYLYGSFHILKSDTQWRTPALDKVFNSADTLYLEVPNIDDQAAATALVQKYGIDPTGSLLKPYTPEEQKLIRETYAKYGLNIDQLVMLKPWLASLMLAMAQMQKEGFDPNIGVDKTLLAAARAKNLPVKGLETMEDQMKLLSQDVFGEESKALLDTVKEDANVKAQFTKLLTAWQTGDLKGMEVLMIDEMKAKTPKMYEAVMVNRNRNWVQPIKDVLAGSGTQMIVVGAGHLAGPDSVQALLKKEGIKVELYDYQSAK
ncbi:TraB/GumN family protein [Asticcacaulis excentricus]|uniref:GumN family protein n=1 Tax=Asticcacaulis excentricus (strain ATCC 15261 / DSM 4724 / KCTC 12464 / NCIMB 9791 / VKM B-1370 / CB 48) TaxID=573065 RepID=E8RQV0_ASTEC|nr:TraB/GumN family protein [Asticcacaulis excentricus]ADU12213.1 GumN family protein [Asticcacaulis excentricus CB 48]